MEQGQNGGRDQQQGAAEELARVLRRWWEEAGGSTGGTRPTQQALATRLGIDQTTLSRYLNPKHLSTAPLRVVETLHAQLRAPAAELDRARALCRAALRESGRQRTVEGPEEDPVQADGGGHGSSAPDADRDERSIADGVDGSGRRQRSRWLRPVLLAAAMVLAFTAGMAVDGRLSAREHRATAGGAAGAVPAGKAPVDTWLALLVEQLPPVKAPPYQRNPGPLPSASV
ncbi:hypothetical protein [Streptomyces sp. NPDC017868]|uniref:hypothetical protein n=1 Tax=Streptomyces sp. NPDC017868 TaxID=3365014 RepID=UPI0037A6144B